MYTLGSEQGPVARYSLRDTPGVTFRVLVGDSVFEPALVTIRDGHLHIEFEASDLDSIALSIERLAEVLAATDPLDDQAG